MTLQPNPLSIMPFIPAEVSSASGRGFGQSTPSVRSRRSEGSSSDEPPVPSQDGFTEVDLRAGGPQLCESPCQTIRPIPRTHEYYEALDGHRGYQLITQLMTICNQERLDFTAMDFCGRRSVYTPERTPIVTLLIYAKRPVVTQRGWANVARKLQNHLRGQGLPEISVEIMDRRFEEDPKVHGCQPNDAVVPMWTDIVNDIIARVDTKGINTIGCFRIGRDTDRSRCPPTVLLGIDRQVFRDWRIVRDAVVSALDSRGLISVGVIIRKDKKPLRASNLETNPVQPTDCRSDPPLGYSLSLSHNMREDAFGTLGGWVELKSPKTREWVSFAVTCAHCCFSSKDGLTDADKEVVWKWKQEGVRSGDANASRLLSIDAPCYRDIKAGIDVKESTMDDIKIDDVYKRAEEAKAQGEFVLPSDEAKWKTLSRMLEALDNDGNTMKSFVRNGQHVLGTVFAASGIREARSTNDPNKLSVRDWALVQPKSGRSAGDNAIRPLQSELPHLHHLGEFEAALPQKDQKVHKIGRLSGFTRGWYSALQSCVLDNETRDGHTVARQTWEHVVTRPSGAFLELGDSGSLLFNTVGEVLGILFGASEKGDIAYFTATCDLLQDIRNITGALEIRMKKQA